MWFVAQDYNFFWYSRWVQPLRSACPWISMQARQMAQDGWPAPDWMRPLYVQRWVGQAIAERLARQAKQATPFVPHFTDSVPCWNKTMTLPYDSKLLHALPELDVLWWWEVEVERLLRMIETPPSEIGEDRWTQAVMGVCGHLLQGYAELKRRCGWRRARALLREVLELFVRWEEIQAEARGADDGTQLTLACQQEAGG